MKNIVLLAFSCLFIGCSSSPSMENTVKKYMTDSIVPKFDDPSSYQYVSMDKPDSSSNHFVILSEKQKYLEDLQIQNNKLHANALEMIANKMEAAGTVLDKDVARNGKAIDSLYKESIALLNAKIEICDKDLLKPDSLNHLIFKVNYRGKNKMGALILDHLNLDYYPIENKFVPEPQ